MFLTDNCINDVQMNPELESELINCFRGENDIVLFPWLVSNFNTYIRDTENIREFVREHEFLRTDEFIFPWKRGRGRKSKYVWYTPNSHDDLIRILNSQGITYACCILDKDKKLGEFSYYLTMYEHHIINNREYRSLIYYENKNQGSKEKVLANLKSVINKYNTI